MAKARASAVATQSTLPAMTSIPDGLWTIAVTATLKGPVFHRTGGGNTTGHLRPTACYGDGHF